MKSFILVFCFTWVFTCSVHSTAAISCSGILGVATSYKPMGLTRTSFPKKYDLSKENNTYLRQAIYKVFGGRDFYTGLKVPYSKMEIDHVWAEDKGGPDNIANYALAEKKVNIGKSNHVDPDITRRRLDIIRNNYADRVYAEYIKLKNVGAQKNITAQRKVDAVEQIDKANLPKSLKTWLKDLVIKEYKGKQSDLPQFTKLLIDFYENLNVRVLNNLKKSEVKQAIHIFEKIISFYLKKKTRPNMKRIKEFLVESYEIKNSLVRTLDLVGSKMRVFKGANEMLSFIQDVSEALEDSAYRNASFRVRSLNRLSLGRIKHKDLRVTEGSVFEVINAILFPPNHRSYSKLSIQNYLTAMSILSEGYTPKEMAKVIFEVREYMRLTRVKTLRAAAVVFNKLRLQDPGAGLQKITSLAFRNID